MAEHPNVARLRRGFDIRTGGEFGADEMAFMDDLFDDEIFWHGAAPGQFSRGRPGQGERLHDVRPGRRGDRRHLRMTVDDIFADDVHGVVTTRGVAERKGRRYEWKEVDLFRLTPDGRILEFWGIPEDQAELDSFFND